MPPGFLAPRYWGTWVLVSMIWLLTKLPYAAQLVLGRALGTLLYAFAKRRRHFARVNLELCSPDLSEAERTRLLREHFKALGLAFLELGTQPRASPARAVRQ